MYPTIRQLALALYGSSRRIERLPRVESWTVGEWAYSRPMRPPQHERFSLACMALSDESQTTESVFAELN